MAPMARRPGGYILQPRAIERHRVVLAGVGVLAATVLAGSCAQIIGIEDLPRLLVDAAPTVAPDAAPLVAPDAGLDGYAVRGTAIGMLGPVALELRIDGDSELLAVTQDGTFSFDTRLETGASFTVVLVDPGTPCTLRNQTGVIAGTNTAIELTCTGASLTSVVVSGIAPAVTLVLGTNEVMGRICSTLHANGRKTSPPLSLEFLVRQLRHHVEATSSPFEVACDCALLGELIFASGRGGIYKLSESDDPDEQAFHEPVLALRNACFHPANLATNPNVPGLVEALRKTGARSLAERLATNWSLISLSNELARWSIERVHAVGRYELLALGRW
jgi:hypothetical protein